MTQQEQDYQDANEFAADLKNGTGLLAEKLQNPEFYQDFVEELVRDAVRDRAAAK